MTRKEFIQLCTIKIVKTTTYLFFGGLSIFILWKAFTDAGIGRFILVGLVVLCALSILGTQFTKFVKKKEKSISRFAESPIGAILNITLQFVGYVIPVIAIVFTYRAWQNDWKTAAFVSALLFIQDLVYRYDQRKANPD